MGERVHSAAHVSALTGLRKCVVFCLAAVMASAFLSHCQAEDVSEYATTVILDESPPSIETSTTPRDASSAKGDFLEPKAAEVSAEANKEPQPAADNKDAAAPAAGENKAEAEKKDTADTGAENSKVEVVPPPPTPTAEDLTKRRERAAEYKSLGEKFFDFPAAFAEDMGLFQPLEQEA